MTKEKRGFHIIKKSKINVHSRTLEWVDAISDMGQVWKKGSHESFKCVRDQFQFMVVTNPNNTYDLYRAGEYLITTHTLDGAKYISLILLNERILKS